MNVQPQMNLESNVYSIEGNTRFKSVGTLNNKKLSIKSIPIDLVLGNKNKMDQDLMLFITPKEILTIDQYH